MCYYWIRLFLKFNKTPKLGPANNPTKPEITFDINEKTLTIVPDNTRSGKLCNVVVFAVNPTDSNDMFLFERKGKATDEDIDCGSSVVFDNIDTNYNYRLMSGDGPSAALIEEIEVGSKSQNYL